MKKYMKKLDLKKVIRVFLGSLNTNIVLKNASEAPGSQGASG